MESIDISKHWAIFSDLEIYQKYQTTWNKESCDVIHNVYHMHLWAANIRDRNIIII